jgi:hypothetical protein
MKNNRCFKNQKYQIHKFILPFPDKKTSNCLFTAVGLQVCNRSRIIKVKIMYLLTIIKYVGLNNTHYIC